MRVFLVLFYTFFIGVNSVFAYDLVLPKEKKNYVNTEYAFFIGKAGCSEDISINNEKIYIAPNGAFSHSVKLKDGENRIIVKSNFNTQVYKFYKSARSEFVKPELIEFSPKLCLTKKDNVPLRKTPVDYGMNRISHLFSNTFLIIDGELGDFYRVKLSKDNYAWIFKEYVVETTSEIQPAFVNIETKTYKNASVSEVEFTENLPYTIEEIKDEIILKIYNPINAENSVYTLNIKKPEFYKYKMNLENGKYVFKVSELPDVKEEDFSNLSIIVDPGHGGNENGAIGCLGDKEKDINLKIAHHLKEFLSLSRANVYMTRECDGYISLDDRVNLAKEKEADIFISIHLNSIPDIKMDINKNKGTSVYYYNENSKKLAELVKNSITNSLNTRDDGVKTASFAVIRPAEYVGVLIEVAYMTNPIDSVIYTNEDFALNTAKAIYEALKQYVSKK